MFSRLPESNAQRQRRGGGLVLSTAFHVVVVALAVRATTLTATPPKQSPVQAPIYLAPPEAPPAPRAPATPAAPRTSASEVPAPPATPLVAPVEIPTTIPEPGLTSILVSEKGLERAFQPGNPVAGRGDGGGPNVSGDQPLPAPYVDRVVVALPGSAPRYPSLLQSAGVEGDVRAQFVVDTLGRVESGSVRILDATHPSFAQAVRDALARARFVPAEAGGRKVRQLVEQAFSFKLTAR